MQATIPAGVTQPLFHFDIRSANSTLGGSWTAEKHPFWGVFLFPSDTRLNKTSGSNWTFFESNLASGPRTRLSAAAAWDVTADLSISEQPAAATLALNKYVHGFVLCCSPNKRHRAILVKQTSSHDMDAATARCWNVTPEDEFPVKGNNFHVRSNQCVLAFLC